MHSSVIMQVSSLKIKGARGRVPGKGKGEGPREKVQVLWICIGVGVVMSRGIRDEYRI